MKSKTVTKLQRYFIGFLSIFYVLTVPAATFATTDFDIDASFGGFEWAPIDDGCGVASSVGSIQPGPVYVIGDSIANGAKDKFEGEGSPFKKDGWSITVEAKDGRHTSEAVDIINDSANAEKLQSAKAVIIELGANDGGDYATQIKAVTAALKGKTGGKVFWANIASNTNVTTYSANNLAIKDNATTEKYTMINWFNQVFPTGDPQNISSGLVDSKGYLSDGLHLSETGEQPFVDYYFSQVSSGAGASGGGSLPDTVPEPYRTLFPEAAAASNADVVAVTLTFLSEHGGTFPDPAGPWASSGAGASGPFQFLPSTWESYKMDGDGDGTMNIQDLEDAAYGAAKLQASNGATVGVPFGDPNDPYSVIPSIVTAMIAYNWGPAHVERRDSPLPAETQKYLQLAAKNFQDLFNGTLVSGGVSTNCTNGGGGLGISADGFVFPIKTTKERIKNASPLKWCTESQDNCHHDYNAADIFDEVGTENVAAKPGNVVSANERQGGSGSGVTIKGDDGNVYYYGHMGFGTLQVHVGDPVAAGDVLGTIGPSEQAQGTQPHLHFDILPSTYQFRPGCVSEQCTSLPFFNVQPLLIPAFEKLPEA